jgi:hypothetical protein
MQFIIDSSAFIDLNNCPLRRVGYCWAIHFINHSNFRLSGSFRFTFLNIAPSNLTFLNVAPDKLQSFKIIPVKLYPIKEGSRKIDLTKTINSIEIRIPVH